MIVFTTLLACSTAIFISHDSNNTTRAEIKDLNDYSVMKYVDETDLEKKIAYEYCTRDFYIPNPCLDWALYP